MALAPDGTPTWRKSSFSSDTANCVEVAVITPHIAVRDSKDPTGPELHFPAAVWADFVRSTKDGTFDLPV